MSVLEASSTAAPESATQAWDALAEQVDALIAAWEKEDRPPHLGRFIPTPSGRHLPMILAELVKVDLEFRWHQRREPKKLEEYAAEFPQLAPRGQLPSDLIYEEYHIRRQAGDAVQAGEYYERFPEQATQLKRLLGLEDKDVTTTLCGGRKKKTLSVGDKIDDFDLLTQLGEGAFAQVFLARQISMQRIVALKVSADKGTEPQTLAMLDHPHIVRVYDQRVLKEKRLRVMYMQHIPGGTLQAVVERVRKTPVRERTGKILLAAVDAALDARGEMPPTESSLRRRLERGTWGEAVCWLGARLAAGLDYAHQQGVLHRDVKPANVLLTAEGSPKLVDFNISFSSKVEGATPAAYFGGSLAYMSPEQLEAADVNHDRQPDSLDGRSDLYSLGIILWELLQGERPFKDEIIQGDWNATLRQLTERRRQGISPEMLAKLPADIPPGLAAVLMQCLRPDADDRPGTAGVLAKQLDLCLKPQVQRLLLPKPGVIPRFLKRYPLPVLIFLALAANGILSVFNTLYNKYQIVDKLNDKAVEKLFWDFQVPTVNGFCYTFGLVAGIWVVWPVFQALWKIQKQPRFPGEQLPKYRRRCARIGQQITWITIGLWIPSGISFPLWLWAQLGADSNLNWEHFAHFGGSNLLCGLMASTLTYFPCTAYSLRYLFPRFVRPEAPAEESDFRRLTSLERTNAWFFGLAIAAPFIAMFLYATVPGVPGVVADSAAIGKWLMAGLATLGLCGCGLAFLLYRGIQADLAALEIALDPSRAGGVETDSFDSSWTKTR